jgi:site-specific DNA recombinase
MRQEASISFVVKEKLERLIIEQVRSKPLTDANLEQLVVLVNEELQSASSLLSERVDVIDAELRDVSARLSKHYEALETGELELNDLAPRIRELKARQDELNKARIEVEAEMVARGFEQVDAAVVKAYAQDLRGLLEEADLTERKAFLRSFVRRIEIDRDRVTIHYNLPQPQEERLDKGAEVLPIDTHGGAGGTRTPDLLTASQMFSL